MAFDSLNDVLGREVTISVRSLGIALAVYAAGGEIVLSIVANPPSWEVLATHKHTWLNWAFQVVVADHNSFAACDETKLLKALDFNFEVLKFALVVIPKWDIEGLDWVGVFFLLERSNVCVLGCILDRRILGLTLAPATTWLELPRLATIDFKL